MHVLFYSTSSIFFDPKTIVTKRFPTAKQELEILAKNFPEHRFTVATQLPGMFFLDLNGTENFEKAPEIRYEIIKTDICCTVAYAADDPLAVINNLSTFIFGLIRAVGLIILGFGIVQVGLSLKSHDPSQRANGFLTLAGGVVITFAKEILDLIVG